MLGNSGGVPNFPENFQMPADEVEDIASLGVVPVVDEIAQRLADERLAFEAKKRRDNLMYELGMEQKAVGLLSKFKIYLLSLIAIIQWAV